MKDETIYKVAQWLDSCSTRFKNMHDAGLDEHGYPAIQKALEHYNDKGYFTIGQILYLWNRTDPRGVYPTYNKHKSYNKIYGEMMECPLKDLVDSNLINWRTGVNGVMTKKFADAIRSDTMWEWRAGTLRARYDTTFNDLFGEP